MITLENSSHIITKITGRAGKRYISSYSALIRGIAETLGFTEKEIGHLDLINEEACLNVIEHAYEGDESSYFDIILEKRPGKFVLSVEDRGLPIDWGKIERGEGIGLGLKIIKAYVDEIRFVNLGKEGKRIEYVKNLPAEYPDAKVLEGEDKGVSEHRLPGDVPLAIRVMGPDEGFALARCFYRCYGYSYFDFIYHPEKISDLIEQGLQTSIVASTPEGEIVGHFGLSLEKPDSRVAESGQAVVLPVFRGRKLFESMKEKAAEYALEKGIYGFYSESVTIHPYTQKANLKLGATETGILLDYAPQQLSFKSIDAKIQNRQTTVLFYMKIGEEPSREAFPPPEHYEIIESIYKRGKFRRSLKESSVTTLDDLQEDGIIEVKVVPDLMNAYIKVIKYGKNLGSMVRAYLRDMRINRMSCIYLDLPMSDPCLPAATKGVEEAGFSFAGIIPEFHDGDMLRFQYLNNLSVDPRESVLESDFCKNLFTYVMDKYEKSLTRT